jgi:hypothetical protein
MPAQQPKVSKSQGGEFRDPVSGMLVTDKQMREREAELQKKEAEIAALEGAVADGTYKKPASDKNFPPLLKWWAWHPRRDLKEDLVGPMQKIRWLFIGWAGAALINVVGCLACLTPSVSKKLKSPATMIVLSILGLVVFCPLATDLALFTLYKAMRNAKALKFFCGLGVYAIWILYIVFCVLGIMGTGSLGIIATIDVFGANAVVGVIGLIFSLGGAAIAVLKGLSFVWLIRYYRRSGLKDKAFREGAELAAKYAKDHPDQAQTVATAVATA